MNKEQNVSKNRASGTLVGFEVQVQQGSWKLEWEENADQS